MTFPGGRKFALSILDDTDVATVESIRPVYEELRTCGIMATKTVWMKRSSVPNTIYRRSQTMEDADYADYVLSLQQQGFEIAFHGASMESSNREEIIQALDQFRKVFGSYPRIHVNHGRNQDNLYWGPERFGLRLIRIALRCLAGHTHEGADHFQGHVPGSPFFWGDLCREHVDYVRNFCFEEINQGRINPSQPYHDPRCSFVKFWFSGLDAPEVLTFNRLLRRVNLDRLEKEGGVCIVATHFGKFFVQDGLLNSETQAICRDLASRKGWYPTVSELLDHLRTRVGWRPIGRRELRMLEWRWLAHRLGARRGLRPEWA
ncbi:MAG TPA: hypothetical protein VN317_03755 [Candidatus Methanoperedens sp.]|nr:hypothetical protein [Candidatus Methanoperedens sp.]